MEGPTRPGGQQGENGCLGNYLEVEADYIQRIMRSLTDSSTSSQAADQSNEEESGIGSICSYDGRISDTSPWSYFAPELSGLAVDNCSEPANWRSNSPQILSPMQREILADFPWLNEELDHRRLINTGATTTGAASSSEQSFPRFTSSKEESDACTTSMISAPEPSIVTPTDRVAWAQSMLELQSYEYNSSPVLLPLTRDNSSKAQTRFLFDQAQSPFPDRSTSVTPANSESDLSSSLSDGEAELKKRSKSGKDGGVAAVLTSAQRRGRRKRAEDGELDVRSDGQESTKKRINRPRKKGDRVKRVREPRYAIKTRTDTEVMDDGYKWRKYGQKAVKNSPNPRNYYRCTTPSCPVRKRVERCFEDPGLVVTTYEGTHTHQSPSFLRGPPGYPGGSLQSLLATLSHHYTLAGNPPVPPFHPPGGHISAGGFPLSTPDLYQGSRMNHYDHSLKNPSFSDQLGGSQLNCDPLDYSSLLNDGGEQFHSVQHQQQQQPPFGRRPEYVGAGRENFRAAPFSASSDQGGLLEDMFRSRA